MKIYFSGLARRAVAGTGLLMSNLKEESVATALAMLFFYAATSKLIDFDESRHEMLNQVFPPRIAGVLVWAVPCVELLIMYMLLIKATILKGLYASLILLSAFTMYIAITMSGVFGRIPCSCGGILKNMSYWTHLVFNLFFIALALLGIAIEKQWTINKVFHFLKRKEVSQI